MKVAFDIGPLTSGDKVRGVGFYTKRLLEQLHQLAKKDKKFILHEINTEDIEKKADKYDMVHIPYFNTYFKTLPDKLPPKTVVSIHDLIYLVYPKQYPPGTKGKMRFIKQKRAVKKLSAIITDTESSKKDIFRFLDYPREKIFVTHLASSPSYKVIKNRNFLREVKRKYNLPEKFVLYVGDINYNKNIPGLIEGCKIANAPLVIVGKQALDIEKSGIDLPSLEGPRDWVRFLFDLPHPELAHYRKLERYFENGHKIIRTGFAPDEDLAAIYNLATLYCQPSFYEGFGLPVLEAMASGCPVVAARTQAVVEVGGDAALYFDPKSPEDIGKNISKVYRSNKLQSELSRIGLKRNAEFSWKRTAEETVDVYRKVCGE